MKAGSATNNNSPPAANNPSTNTSTVAANGNGTVSASGASSSLGNSAAGAPNTTIGHYIIGRTNLSDIMVSREGAWEGHIRAGQAGYSHSHRWKGIPLCLLIVLGCSENPRKREDKGQEGRGENHQRNQDPEEGAPPQCHPVIRGKAGANFTKSDPDKLYMVKSMLNPLL